MVLIDFLNKTIPGGQKKFFRQILPPPKAKILCTRLFTLYQSRLLNNKEGGAMYGTSATARDIKEVKILRDIKGVKISRDIK